MATFLCRRLVPVSAVLLVAACTKHQLPAPRSGCDLAALESLSRAMEAAPISEQVTASWPGLELACGDALPKLPRAHFESVMQAPSWVDQLDDDYFEQLAEISRLYTSICPQWAQVEHTLESTAYDTRAVVAYEECGLDRYGVFEADEVGGRVPAMMSWVMHQWLLEQGLEAKLAAPLTRALYAREQLGLSLIAHVPGLAVPKAPGVPLEDGVLVYVARDHIRMGDQTLVELTDGLLAEADSEGHVIRALFEPLELEVAKSIEIAQARGERWDQRLLLVADQHTPYATLVDILYTAGRLGFSRYGFVVEPERFAQGYVPFAPEPFGPAYCPERTGFGPELLAPAVPEAELRRVLLCAEPTVVLQDIVGAIAAVRGPGCERAGAGCVPPDVTSMSPCGGASCLAG